ncbi:unnamed protein product, partial [Musa acuminata subsp. malaccensis]
SFCNLIFITSHFATRSSQLSHPKPSPRLLSLVRAALLPPPGRPITSISQLPKVAASH